jgi:hypothetical protein
VSTSLTRNSVAYVKNIKGDKRSRSRAWPQKAPERPEGPFMGQAPELSALLVLDVAQVSIPVGGTTKTFPNPRTDPGGRVWWYVRAYAGDKKTVVQGWMAENEGNQVYLELLPSHDGCKVWMHTQRPSHLRHGMQAYVVPANGLIIRSDPLNTAPVVGGLPVGSVVTVAGEAQCDTNGRVWWRISQGWICENEPIQGPPDEDRVAWYLLPMRSQP